MISWVKKRIQCFLYGHIELESQTVAFCERCGAVRWKDNVWR